MSTAGSASNSTPAMRADADKTIQLTEKEQAFLSEHPVLKVHMEENYPPYSLRKASGEFTGYSVAYARLVAQRLGVDFQYSQNETWDQALQNLKNKRIDIIAQAINTLQRRKFAIFSDAYMTYSTFSPHQK